MKKFVAILMVVMMILAMTACGNVTPFGEDSSKVNESIVTDESSKVDDSNKVDESSSSTGASTTKPTESSTENSTVESTTKPTETSKPAESTQPTHTHSWNPVYKTVHHDAVTHTVHHNAEYKEEKTLTGYEVVQMCALFKDGHVIDPYDYNYDGAAYSDAIWEYQKYLFENGVNSAYSNGNDGWRTHIVSVEIFNAYTDTFASYKGLYNTTKTLIKDAYDETVVDKAAYDEKVIDYYKCDCGAIK